MLPSDDTVRRVLHRLGLRLEAAALRPGPRPRAREKTPHPAANPGPATSQRRAGRGRDRPDAVPAVAGRLVAEGEPAEVHISGRNARRVVFGTMNLLTGTRLLLPQPKGRAGNFQAFLKEIRWHYRGWHVALLLDEDPSHRAKKLREGLADSSACSAPRDWPRSSPSPRSSAMTCAIASPWVRGRASAAGRHSTLTAARPPARGARPPGRPGARR